MDSKLAKYFVYIPTAFIAIGCIYTSAYYSTFGIPIFQYLSIQEGILEFMNDSLVFVIIILYLPVNYLFNTYSSHLLEKINPDKIQNPVERRTKKIIYDLFFLILSIILFLQFLSMIIKNWSPSAIYFFIFILIISFAFIFYNKIVLHFHNTFKNSNMTMSIQTFNTLFFTFILVLFMFGVSKFRANFTLENNFETGSQIHTNDSIIQIKDKLIFVGKSEKYVFIHNVSETTNIIIPVDQVKLIKYKHSEKRKPKPSLFKL